MYYYCVPLFYNPGAVYYVKANNSQDALDKCKQFTNLRLGKPERISKALYLLWNKEPI